jgi:magnesium chelatase accessory protein
MAKPPPIDIFQKVPLASKRREKPPGLPDWSTDGKDWPNRSASLPVPIGSQVIHTQMMGKGPVALLLHGTGAATHSWRDLMPALAENFTVIACDLPGHGFTTMPREELLTLPGMASVISRVLRRLGHEPAITVGHSAGAAILAHMAIDEMIAPKAMVSLNGAMLPLKTHKAALPILAPLGRVFARSPVVPFLFAWHASDPKVVDRLLAQTGSTIDPEGAKFYAILAKRSSHVAGALRMMSNWDLESLSSLLTALKQPTLLVAGSNDLTIPPEQAEMLHKLITKSRVVILPGLGHLAHEERPREVADLIVDYAREYGVLPA